MSLDINLDEQYNKFDRILSKIRNDYFMELKLMIRKRLNSMGYFFDDEAQFLNFLKDSCEALISSDQIHTLILKGTQTVIYSWKYEFNFNLTIE